SSEAFWKKLHQKPLEFQYVIEADFSNSLLDVFKCGQEAGTNLGRGIRDVTIRYGCEVYINKNLIT
ncbi:hypothetical protein, partial [Novacetimonas hansenii]|uniref:hypothetical protein n=1 Tax=Novacetimonas hansenii TaxID=436 RepID=UPI001A7E9FFA